MITNIADNSEISSFSSTDSDFPSKETISGRAKAASSIIS
jgi:hypothetical protein